MRILTRTYAYLCILMHVVFVAIESTPQPNTKNKQGNLNLGLSIRVGFSTGGRDRVWWSLLQPNLMEKARVVDFFGLVLLDACFNVDLASLHSPNECEPAKWSFGLRFNDGIYGLTTITISNPIFGKSMQLRNLFGILHPHAIHDQLARAPGRLCVGWIWLEHPTAQHQLHYVPEFRSSLSRLKIRSSRSGGGKLMFKKGTCQCTLQSWQLMKAGGSSAVPKHSQTIGASGRRRRTQLINSIQKLCRDNIILIQSLGSPIMGDHVMIGKYLFRFIKPSSHSNGWCVQKIFANMNSHVFISLCHFFCPCNWFSFLCKLARCDGMHLLKPHISHQITPCYVTSCNIM